MVQWCRSIDMGNIICYFCFLWWQKCKIWMIITNSYYHSYLALCLLLVLKRAPILYFLVHIRMVSYLILRIYKVNTKNHGWHCLQNHITCELFSKSSLSFIVRFRQKKWNHSPWRHLRFFDTEPYHHLFPFSYIQWHMITGPLYFVAPLQAAVVHWRISSLN